MRIRSVDVLTQIGRLLLHDGQNIALTYDGAFLAVHLHFGAGVLAGENLIAYLDDHLHFLAIYHAAGANCQNLGHLGLLLGGTGQDDAALGGFFGFNGLVNNAICKRALFSWKISSYSK